jgi:hypothetical protein
MITLKLVLLLLLLGTPGGGLSHESFTVEDMQ